MNPVSHALGELAYTHGTCSKTALSGRAMVFPVDPSPIEVPGVKHPSHAFAFSILYALGHGLCSPVAAIVPERKEGSPAAWLVEAAWGLYFLSHRPGFKG